jgi:hypothetical protein
MYGRAPVANYRFYFLNSEDHIVAVAESAERNSDADAKLIAVRLFGEQQKHPCIEIWQSNRKVSRHRL